MILIGYYPGFRVSVQTAFLPQSRSVLVCNSDAVLHSVSFPPVFAELRELFVVEVISSSGAL
jgi:hypothetical protein